MDAISDTGGEVARVAEVHIDDELVGDLVADAERHGRQADAETLIAEALTQAIRAAAHGEYAVCGLTGCRTRYAFRRDLERDNWGKSWADQSLYIERFLCVDIDGFQRYVDSHGYGPSDQVLVHLATALLAHHGDKDVYRYGGDDFVIRLRDRDPWLPDPPDGVSLKWSVLAIRARRPQRQTHHFERWIEHEVSGAFFSATPAGAERAVETPAWMQAR